APQKVLNPSNPPIPLSTRRARHLTSPTTCPYIQRLPCEPERVPCAVAWNKAENPAECPEKLPRRITHNRSSRAGRTTGSKTRCSRRRQAGLNEPSRL